LQGLSLAEKPEEKYALSSAIEVINAYIMLAALVVVLATPAWG
jgi:hypothetical protein